MNRTPIAISLILLFVAFMSSHLLFTNPALVITDGEKVTSLIALWACFGALVSATFVICSYMQTNYAFIQSQKPFLLIQVVNEKLKQDKPDSPSTITAIHYKNITNNSFTDLSLRIVLSVANREIDLSDLFKKKMFMAAHDARVRRFEPVAELVKRGIKLNDEVQSGNIALLRVGYSHTFNNKIVNLSINEYQWNSKISQWQLT